MKLLISTQTGIQYDGKNYYGNSALANAMRNILSDEKFAVEIGKNAMKIRDELSLEKVCKH